MNKEFNVNTSQKTYSKKLLDPRWQKKRLEILQRDNFSCRICSDKENTLHVHHLKYSNEPWGVEDSALVTLCDKCHDTIHRLGNIEVGESACLDPFEFIMTDPILIISTLSYITNHKGIWRIEFRNTASPVAIIRIVTMLYRFITPIDCNIEIMFDVHSYYGSQSFKVSDDVYEFLSQLDKPFE